MTDDDFELHPADVAQWDAIVASEWPDETARVSTHVDLASVPPSAHIADPEPQVLTIYRPRRPALTPLIAAIVAASAGAWIFIMVLAPTYQLAAARGFSPHERADEIRQLTIAAFLVAVALALTAGCLAAWLVTYSRYRLRRSSCDQVTRRATPMTRYLRPPNPATAAAWILLLLSASGVAGWWIPLQFERASGSGADAIEALGLASSGALVWMAVFVLCTAGLTTWGASEARHRLRRRSVTGGVASGSP